MTLPTRNDVHVDQALQNLSIAFMQDARGLEVPAPVVPVTAQSDKYFVWDRADFMRIEVKERAPGAESAGAGMRLSTDTYSATRYALHKDIARETMRNSSTPLDLDRSTVAYLTQQMAMKRLDVFSQNFLQTGLWTSNTEQTGVAAAPGANQFLQWNDASSTPIEDIRAEIATINTAIGRRPTHFVTSLEVFHALADHPDVIDRIKHTQRAITTPDILAELLGLERFVVLSGTNNTAAEGQTETMSPLVGKVALLAWFSPTAAIDMPSAGYMFSWSEFDGGANAPVFRRMDVPLRDAERIEAEMYFDAKITGNAAGVFFNSAVA